ncbi:MAG: tRNA (guanosine(37)-N1)-methyltransferase TrmD [Patescibacteria group bacterium]|nr:tRNA (guanosine(37)-N1)-methyltransferase TrmD [bacterium]MDZ4226361.1 tRNA (guanosine(37)-N1)-methyltransferase TrmD [Patescibacteria group bacterium]
MKFSVLTLFPESVSCYFASSMLARAQDAGLINIELINPRDYSLDKHKCVDDAPYGGGPGMVMMVQPLVSAWENVTANSTASRTKAIIFSPSGEKLTNEMAREWATEFDHLVLIAGRYEGVDARVREIINATEISIGDYVLTGGEVPAMALVDVVSRQIKGVLGNQDSLEEERAASHKVYTRPETYTHKGEDFSVPEILLKGHHKMIEEWRKDN